MKKQYYNIPIFVPHKGCPHDCVFCNQKKIIGSEEEVCIDEYDEMIASYIESFSGDYTCEIAFFGGSFTGIRMSEQIKYLELAKKWMDKGLVHGIRLSTRPDYINEKILENLKKYGVTTIELGVQSLDHDVLYRSNRGHSIKHVISSVSLIKQYGFKIGLQMMIGLPGDSKLKTIRTAHRFVSLKPDLVRIYPTLVIKDTYLEELYNEGLYEPLDIDTAASWTSALLEIFESNDIPVIRVGLQPTELLLSGEALVAGPFHPSFRQLAEGKLFLRKIMTAIEERLTDEDKNHGEEIPYKALTIKTNSRSVSMASGLKSCNKELLIQKYGFRKIKFESDNSLNALDVVIELK